MRSPFSKLLVFGFMASVFQLGCSGRGARSGEGGVVVEKDTEIVHEECDVASDSSERLDANGDGKADVTIVKIGNRELCRALGRDHVVRVDRAGLPVGDEGRESCLGHVSSPPRFTSCLAMTPFWISLVPSPTIIRGASRK